MTHYWDEKEKEWIPLASVIAERDRLRTEVEQAEKRGYDRAVAALRSDVLYRNWWSSDDCQPDKPARQHLGDFLEAVRDSDFGGGHA